MTNALAAIGIVLAMAVVGHLIIQNQRDDAVRDFMRDAAVAEAERRGADQEALTEITEEIEDATTDELRARAITGGMFSDEPDGTSTGP